MSSTPEPGSTGAYRAVPAQVDLPALEREVLALWRERDTFARSLRADRGRAPLDVLRGPADRQRHARDPPRRGPRLQGRLPPLQDHEGLPRAPQGRLGLPRPAGGAGRREGARLLRQGRHRGVRRRRVQRPLPRVRRAARRRVRVDDRADGLLGGHVHRLPDHGLRLRRGRLVVAQADLRPGPARPGPPGRAVLPALRHRAVRPRARPGVRDRRRPVRLRPVPAHRRPAGRAAPRRGPAGLDDDPVDAGLQHRRGRAPPRSTTSWPARPTAPRRWSSPSRCSRRPWATAPRCWSGSPARELAGERYAPPFDLVDIPDAHQVVTADYVTTEDGSGLVHIAPAFGADDLVGRPRARPAGRQPDHAPTGTSRRACGSSAGCSSRRPTRRSWPTSRPAGCCPAAPAVRAHLPALLALPHPAHVLRAAVLVHPHHRHQGRPAPREREHPLVPGDDPARAATATGWTTTSTGRCRATATGAPRCRSGGAPQTTPTSPRVGSLAELGELAGQELSALDPHRPYVDDVVLPCPTCGAEARRVPEVIDCWYDSGAMPFAQWGYPHRGAEEFDASYPADFICEAIDQTRGWFYTLMAIGTLVFDASSYRNVLCLGHILDEDGRKMSKHLGNVLEPIALMDQHGADAVRWFMAASGSPWQARRVGHHAIAGGRPQDAAHLLEHGVLPVAVRPAGRLRPGDRGRPGPGGPPGARPLGAVRGAPAGRGRRRRAGGLRHAAGRPAAGDLRRRPVELVRPPVAAPVLAGRPRGPRHAARVPADHHPADGPVHAVHHRAGVAGPLRARRPGRPRLGPPGGVAGRVDAALVDAAAGRADGARPAAGRARPRRARRLGGEDPAAAPPRPGGGGRLGRPARRPARPGRRGAQRGLGGRPRPTPTSSSTTG